MKIMRNIKLIGVLLAATLSMTSVVAYADAVSSQKLAELLGKLPQAQGNFAETVYTQRGAVLQKTAGTFGIKRPGKLFWNTQTPYHQLLVADGKNIWFYDKDLQQVTKQSQLKQQPHSPAALLSGDVSQLNQDYDVTQQGSTFLLKPKKAESFFSQVKLVFKDSQLVSMTIIDNMNQTSKIDFNDIRATVDEKLFSFTPPSGADVVAQG